jgi:hypothetical protein
MARTITEIQLELDALNAAILARLRGTRFQVTRFNSGDFSRYYEDKTSLDDLYAIRTRVQSELETISPTTIVSYRSSSTMITCRK